MDPITIAMMAMGGVQSISGIINGITGNAKSKKLMAQRKPYEAPEEYSDIYNLTSNLAQQGYDAFTLNYLNEQVDRSIGTSLNAATTMGADPNSIADILDRDIQARMKIGADNATKQFENFNKFMSAMQMMAGAEEAEWASRDNLIKDQLQQAANQKEQGFQNAMTGLNTIGSGLAMQQQSNLYDNRLKAFEQLFGSTPESIASQFGGVISADQQKAMKILGIKK